MKKVLCFVTGVVIAASIVTGCSSNKAVGTEGGQNNSSISQSAGGNGQNNTLPRISGEVATINGNTITLKLTSNVGRGIGRGNQQGGQINGQNGGQRQGNGQGQNDATTGATANGQNQGGGNVAPDNGQNTQGAPQNGQAQKGQRGARPNMQPTYTGETKTITIPDGISITTFSRDANGGTQANLAIKDIKVGDLLSIAYTDSSEKTISQITVMNINLNQGQPVNQNQQQNSNL